jgi:hypothetical protein
VSYRELAELLTQLGVVETERSVASKMSRGSFSFAFYLQVMKALGRPTAHIDLTDIAN